MKHVTQISPVLLALLCAAGATAQQGQQPPAYTAPQPTTSPVQMSPGQQQAPQSQQPNASPDGPLPQPDGSSIDLRAVKPLQIQPPQPAQPSNTIRQVDGNATHARGEAAPAVHSSLLHPIAPYHV
ncbi:MAG: hypothetical protein ACRYGF_07635, partial [Janthinobacterium lividum]